MKSYYIVNFSHSETFHFVAITEYFDESLVLLKNALCWNLEDVVYVSLNKYRGTPPVSETDKPKYRKLIREKIPEYAKVYDTYLSKFQETLDMQPESFWADVTRLKQLNSEMEQHCRDKTHKRDTIKCPGHLLRQEQVFTDLFRQRQLDEMS